MALQTSGPISAADILSELDQTGVFSMNDAEERKLADKTAANETISFSDFYGKSNVQLMKFKFTIGAKAIDLGADYTRRVGVSDQADTEWRFGTPIDRRGTMIDKNGDSHVMELYYFVAEFFDTAGPELIPGEPGPSVYSWQAFRISAFRTDGGSTAGTEFNYATATIQILNDATNELIFSGPATVAEGNGTGGSYMNFSVGASTTDPVSSQKILYDALSDNVGVTVRAEFRLLG